MQAYAYTLRQLTEFRTVQSIMNGEQVRLSTGKLQRNVVRHANQISKHSCYRQYWLYWQHSKMWSDWVNWLQHLLALLWPSSTRYFSSNQIFLLWLTLREVPCQTSSRQNFFMPVDHFCIQFSTNIRNEMLQTVQYVSKRVLFTNISMTSKTTEIRSHRSFWTGSSFCRSWSKRCDLDQSDLLDCRTWLLTSNHHHHHHHYLTPFNASCSKLLMFQGFSATLV